MPTLRQLVKHIQKIERESKGELGAYPIIFKNDWEKIKFILLLKFENTKTRIKRLWAR